jgi:hypothetical protein
MNDEMIEKVRELVRTRDPKDGEIALQMLQHRNHDELLMMRGIQDVLAFDNMPIVCEYLHRDTKRGLVILTTNFVKIIAPTAMNGIIPSVWRLEEERLRRIIDKRFVLTLRKGFNVWQNVGITLSFWDRIKVLFGAKIEVRCKHDCDKEVEVSKGSATVTVGKPKVMTSQING